MSNRPIVDYFNVTPSFHSMMESVTACKEEKYEGLKTFFGKYRNPIGIEIEAENYRGLDNHGNLNFWRMVQDGSLRNNGIEFVSRPIAGRYIDYAIAEVAEYLKPQNISWSHRTSIHVHNNMSTMRMDQLTAFVALYGLFEDVFFSMVEPFRVGNPYCYPATSIDPQLYTQINPENKYCALNLAPLKTQCTVEFRHMHGHEDWRQLRRWCQLIVKLSAFIEGMDNKTVISTMKGAIDSGQYIRLFKECFGALAILFPLELVLRSAEKNVLWSITILNQGFE